MPAAPPERERRALRFSLAATTSIAVAAVIWGWLAGSQVILLDGAYALIGMGLTAVSLAASRLAASRPTSRFPYGREALVPLTVALQGVALFGTLAYAALEAVRVLLAGGSEVAPASLVAYGALTAVACWVVSRRLPRMDPLSDLVSAEARQWSASSVFSLVVAVGAVGALALGWFGFVGVAPYVDSALVLIGCALLLPQPIALFRTALIELLEGAPAPDVQETVTEALLQVRHRHELPEPTIRMTKLGRKLYIDAVFLVEPGRWAVDQEDAVRREAVAALADLPYEPCLSVHLTTDPLLTY